MKSALIAAPVIMLLAAVPMASAGETFCSVYVTGIGCPNCAITDPAVISEFTSENPNLLVIEYEIYQKVNENYETSQEYFSSYIPPGVRPGIPLFVLDTENAFIGRYEVLEAADIISGNDSNSCPAPDGSSADFSGLDITTLPGEPTLWSDNRVLVPEEGGGDNELLKQLLFDDDIAGTLKELGYEETDTVPVKLSGGEVSFEHAVQLDGWLFQWNGDGLNSSGNGSGNGNAGNGSNPQEVSLYSIAAVVLILIAGLAVYFTKLR